MTTKQRKSKKFSKIIFTDNYLRKPKCKHSILLLPFLYFFYLFMSYPSSLLFYPLCFPGTSVFPRDHQPCSFCPSPYFSYRARGHAAALAELPQPFPVKIALQCLAAPTRPCISLSCVIWTKNKICLKCCHEIFITPEEYINI